MEVVAAAAAAHEVVELLGSLLAWRREEIHTTILVKAFPTSQKKEVEFTPHEMVERVLLSPHEVVEGSPLAASHHHPGGPKVIGGGRAAAATKGKEATPAEDTQTCVFQLLGMHKRYGTPGTFLK